MTVELPRPESLDPSQTERWERTDRLISHLHSRSILGSALVEISRDDEFWRSSIEVDGDRTSSLNGPDRTLYSEHDLPGYSWRLEIELKTPFSLAVLLEMVFEFLPAQVFLPEMRLNATQCHSVNSDPGLDMLIAFEND